MPKRRKHASWAHVAFVGSDSEPGVEHAIKRHADGRYGCACLAYRFARGEKTCKHLRAFAAGERVDARPVRQLVRPERVRVTVAAETFTVRRAISFGGSL